MPDEILRAAKAHAAMLGISLQTYLVEAVESRLAGRQGAVRRDPPLIGQPADKPIDVLTAEQLDEAMFG